MMPATNYGEPYMLEVGAGNRFGKYHPRHTISPIATFYHHKR